MKTKIKRIWIALNMLLTDINILVFSILSFTPAVLKKDRDAFLKRTGLRIPIFANIILFVFLATALFATIYNANRGI